MASHQWEDKVIGYLKLIVKEKSLDEIVSALGFNKKTAFNWRHKMWASLGANDGDDFTGVTESNKAFFLKSEKDIEVKNQRKGEP